MPSVGREGIDADHDLTMPEASPGQRRHDGVERCGLVDIDDRVFEIEDDHIRIHGPAFRDGARVGTGDIEGTAAKPKRHGRSFAQPRPWRRIPGSSTAQPAEIVAFTTAPSQAVPRKNAEPSASSPVATLTCWPLGQSFSTVSKPTQPRLATKDSDHA